MPAVIPASSVKHMKWYGWGVEGVGFHHQDKPGFRDFLIKAIGVDPDVPAGTTMSLEDLHATGTFSEDVMHFLKAAVAAHGAVERTVAFQSAAGDPVEVITLTNGGIFQCRDQLGIIARIKAGKGFIVGQLHRQRQLRRRLRALSLSTSSRRSKGLVR